MMAAGLEVKSNRHPRTVGGRRPRPYSYIYINNALGAEKSLNANT